MKIRRIVDFLMSVSLLLLMSKQITEDLGHEYIGFAMCVLLIIHLYLNRQWFRTLFKGRYSAVRALSVTINLALITAFILSGIGGMLIAETLMDIVPESLTELGRSMHVAASYWGIVLMGMHIGMHWSMIAGRVKAVWAKIFAVIFCGWGMYEFLYYGMTDYLILRSHFVFLDYDKNPALLLLENTAMLGMWVLVGHQAGQLAARPRDWKKPVSIFAGMCLVCGVLVLILGMGETF